MFISCKTASRLVSKSLDCPLSWKDKLALRMHLMICKRCKRFMQQLVKLRIAVKTMMASVENDLSIELNPIMKAQIAKEIELHSQ